MGTSNHMDITGLPIIVNNPPLGIDLIISKIPRNRIIKTTTLSFVDNKAFLLFNCAPIVFKTAIHKKIP